MHNLNNIKDLRCVMIISLYVFRLLSDAAPLLVVLGLLYPVAAMIGYVAREKELHQKQLMKMMSVTETDIGWAWFSSFAGFHLFTATLAAVASSILYDNSSFHFLWIFWGMTFLAMIVFALAVAAVSCKALRAVLLGLLVFFTGVFLSLAVDYRGGNPGVIALISLHPAAAFTYGITEIGHLEDLGLGLVTSTVDYTENVSGYSVLVAMRFLGIDTVLWSLLSWYLNRVVPSDFGLNLPLWFPFTTSYWCPRHCVSKKKSAKRYDDDRCDHEDANIPIEPVVESLKRQADEGMSIEMHNLRKSFGDKQAVDGLSLSMFNGHITALLGHNGESNNNCCS